MIVPEQAIRAMQTVVLGDGDAISGHVPSVEDCRAVIEAVAPFLESDAQARIDKALKLLEGRWAREGRDPFEVISRACEILSDPIGEEQ